MSTIDYAFAALERIREMQEERVELLTLAIDIEKALPDYIERLEKQGDIMGHANHLLLRLRAVIKKSLAA